MLKDFRSLYVSWLLEIQNCEKQLDIALPKIAEGVSSPQLRVAVSDHHRQTHIHLDRVEKLLSANAHFLQGSSCEPVALLIREAEESIEQGLPGSLLDAAIVGILQKIEHYEIACYGTACTYAKMLNRSIDAAKLQETLNEEYAADDLLTEIALSGPNIEALASSV